MYEPDFENFTVTGLGLSITGRPLWTRAAPVKVSRLPNASLRTAGAKPSWSSPLNQNGVPAASFAPAIFCPVGTMTGIRFAASTGMSSVWNPTGRNLTLSPT